MADFNAFSLEGKTAVLVGGGGAIGLAAARGLGTVGAHVVVCDVAQEKVDEGAASLSQDGISAEGQAVDALSKDSLAACRDRVIEGHGTVDILVSLVGGNLPEASTTDGRTFFDLPIDAFEKALAINLFGGAILPTQVFLERMVENPDGGAVINTASMNAIRPLTQIPGYSSAKAAVANFTQWLAVHVAQEYTPKVRVNAVAPGFFVTDQNRYLLYDKETGGLTDRGKTVVDHTPMGRMGNPEDVAGAVCWLASPAAAFVTGIVVPVDGGFSAFSGV
ncbi:TPA: D-mannonate oxidoreductase [Candidatus Latescibacteria bacterium]|nr:D-mannonate oxidoreductase [Candidatus Latescibacterota bacterium]